MHIYYTSKKPEVDFRYLEDLIVSLPLLFGVLTYLLILGALTAWLTQYHKHRILRADPKDHLDTEGRGPENVPPKSEPKDSKATTSGNKSIVKDS